MEQLYNGITLETPAGCFPLSTDSMLLADFARLPTGAKVLDLGSGCGTLGLLLCAKDPGCHVTGIELDPIAHEAALENIRRNALDSRMDSLRGDLRQLRSLLPPGSFACCLSNPPYFSGGPASTRTPVARQERYCTPEDLFSAAAWALKFGGDFFLVHKPERLSQLCSCASAVSLEPKHLTLVRHSPGKDISLLLLHCRKGAKPGLKLRELCLYTATGDPTADCQRIYRL